MYSDFSIWIDGQIFGIECRESVNNESEYEVMVRRDSKLIELMTYSDFPDAKRQYVKRVSEMLMTAA